VRRQFKAARPGQLHVADLTYVQMVTGRFAYTAFVIDAFAGLIPGWEYSLSEQAAFVEAAIRQAPPTGPGTGTRSARTRSTIPTPAARAIHQRARHRDAAASRAGALHRNRRRPRQHPAETTIGLYKTECARDGSPFRNGPLETLADVEQTTLA
jgi:putative transposase